MRGVLEFHKYSTRELFKFWRLMHQRPKNLKKFLCALIVGQVYSPMEKE